MLDFSKLCVKEIRSVVRYRPDCARWTAKKRMDHIVGIQISGKAHHTFSHGDFMVLENCIYYFNQKDDYKVRVLQECEAFSIHFTTTEDVDTKSFCIPVSNPQNFISLLQKAEFAFAKGESHQMFSYLYSFCGEIEKARKKTYFPKDKRITEAKEYIDINFKEPDCIRQAVLKSGVGERRFGELFRKIYDETPGKYVTLKRIEYAKILLSTKSISVTEVASLCSFSDVYYFSRQFKTYTGFTPSDFIEKYVSSK